ncbi:hypothetical protein ACKRZS_005765 [Fusarium odoratissimum]
MDPFSILPSLVQTEIFVHLQSDISVKQVIQASPSMLWHFIAYKKSILRCIMDGILNGDTSGDLLRDALGIIYISDKASAKRYRQTEMWKTMELPDTLDLEQLEALWHIISCMIIFIEDYVSKATSECPPRAYLGILDLLNGSGSYFKVQRLDTNAVRFSSLTGAVCGALFAMTPGYPIDPANPTNHYCLPRLGSRHWTPLRCLIQPLHHLLGTD